MRTILIATNFTPASRNAALYGVNLAKALKAKVIFFTAYQVPHQFANLNVQVSLYDAQVQSQSKLTDEVNLITDSNDALVEIACEEGRPHEAIPAIAIEKGVDVIIINSMHMSPYSCYPTLMLKPLLRATMKV